MFGQRAVECRNLAGLGDHRLNDEVDRIKESGRGSRIVAKVNLPAVNRAVADNANDIERLLTIGW